VLPGETKASVEIQVMDVRQKPSLTHEDVVAINFVRSPGSYYFRRHYRMGLRSHIMEVIRPQDLEQEKKGIIVAGVRHFPRARPMRILRIFRTRFNTLDEAKEEIKRVRLIQQCLLPEFVARSEEFLVSYRTEAGFEILLCGLQTYIKGEILDPWAPTTCHPLETLLKRMLQPGNSDSSPGIGDLVKIANKNILEFVARVKHMVKKLGLIPDLAGVGNLLLTPQGGIVLVDINNISNIRFDNTIFLDDRGYPVCDKSMQALYLLEKKALEKAVDPNDSLYGYFLDPVRVEKVKAIELRFHKSDLANCSYNPGPKLSILHSMA